jgi:hypothetical protein
VLRIGAAAWWSLCMLRRARRAARTAVRDRRRRRRPLVDDLGFPARGHPESLVMGLPEGDEEWLAGLAAALWPADEYAGIIRAYLPGPGQGGTP